MSNSVCAVIVTYHPDKDFAQHIAVLRPQVDGLVVVDNRSNDSELTLLRGLANRYMFSLLENPDNLGIGAALNRGIQWAAADGRFQYVVLFDQDSEAGDGFVNALVSCTQRHPKRDRVAVAAPRIHDRNSGAMVGPNGVRRGQYLVAQTSGSLMPLSVFNAEGWFIEELFIDYVDYEYCLRAVTAGWMIVYCEEAILSHVPGNSRRHRLFGLYVGTTGNYSPMRQYYLMRNGTWVLRKYWKRHTMWCARRALTILKEMTKVFLYEEDRAAKFVLAMKGLTDGLQGKLGKLDIPSDKRRPHR